MVQSLSALANLALVATPIAGGLWWMFLRGKAAGQTEARQETQKRATDQALSDIATRLSKVERRRDRRA
jgi:hypothetical protein